MKFFYFKLLLIIGFLCLLTFFTIQNVEQKVDLRLFNLIKVSEIPVVLIIYISMLLGAIFTLPSIRKSSKRISELKIVTDNKNPIKEISASTIPNSIENQSKPDPMDVIMQNPFNKK